MDHMTRVGQRSPSRSGSQGQKMHQIGRKVRNSVADFFGVGEESERQSSRWDQRRKRYAGSIGRLKHSYIRQDADDEPDAGPRPIVDPLHRPSRLSSASTRLSTRRPTRKESVAVMTIKGIGKFMAKRKSKQEDRKSRGTGVDHGGEDAFSLVDDVFYDEARAEQTRAKESTIEQEDKRTVGIGAMGRLLRPSIQSVVFTKDLTMQLDEMEDHRPYFTYWATFVQIVVFIVAVAVYGTAPYGIGREVENKVVRMSNLARETQSHIEQRNIWFGPRQADLIHLGAKYSPCMRVDHNLEIAIDLDKKEENSSACCVRNDGSGCVQRIKSQCGSLSSWKKWSTSNPGPKGRVSGSVCGQDPNYCLNPPSTTPYEWPDDITKWPLCTEREPNQHNVSSTKDRHMNCEVLGHPCCHGIQGECIITTQEHCDLKRGFFHKDAFLCSQVNCFKQICGMIPFADDAKPDQFYRLWTSIFLHSGLVHLLVSVIFQMWIMRDMEKLIGAIRMSIIYLGSGIAGNLASCTFLPYHVETGPSGAQFGILACLLVEMLQSYQMYRRPILAIAKLAGPILVLFILGLLPWFDNWAHLFGFIFGFLLAFALMPYVTFGKFDRHRKIINILVCLGLATVLFIVLILIFYVAPLTTCDSCQYFNCLPFTDDFCDNMQVTFKKTSTYSAFG
ncbi:inactive rhomboid protein 1-like [Pomacea canaliculata]|uniref:inactive rhomboid protein 1-like n=1 Tax=Pomacea canaliculata TaxID=400727 RepID=UPI000D72F303|nr:inactive rhomboid protein 1-like [Pomacea canaliculata]XP_025091547.1 inactive rhomboid protein 1-like [Pomacea canaliculata]